MSFLIIFCVKFSYPFNKSREIAVKTCLYRIIKVLKRLNFFFSAKIFILVVVDMLLYHKDKQLSLNDFAISKGILVCNNTSNHDRTRTSTYKVNKYQV